LSLANCVIIAEVDYSLIPKEDGGSGGAPAGCMNDSECDDGLPCTSDRCEGSCTHTALPQGTECNSIACVTAGSCDANGQCLGVQIVVDDGDACTTDACDSMTGVISHTPVDVDDQIACTTDSCDPATGTISHEPGNAGCLSWQPLPTLGAPDAREQHTAVWTGSKMIIWGGNGGPGKLVLNTGGVYDPTNKTWTPVSLTGAPSARHSHQAVWTGSKMIIWGGFGESGAAANGGMYDPATDTWSPLPSAGEPTLRIRHSALWTGKTMIVFGGLANNVAINKGAAFDPMTNAWSPIATSGQPSPRFNHSAIWAADRMIIWGGQDYADWYWTGSSYNPTTNMWMGPTPGSNVPEGRELHAAVWTGSQMLVWGGWNGGQYLNSGGTFDPATSTWSATTSTGAPTGRAEHSAVWTGKTLVVWGGCGGISCDILFDDGGILTPNASGGTWETIPAAAPMPPRRRHTTVWTGSTMIIWGGKNKSGLLQSGAETPLPL
jgi:Dictyostelium (slime mold) repeat